MSIRLSRHFKLSEFKCKCGKCETNIEDVSTYLVYQLQKLRDQFKLPIKIASGYRCREHNLSSGGAPRSQHVRGKAVDISTKHLSGQDKHRLLQLIMRMGTFTGVGVGAGKLHVDVRDGEPTMWFYY